MPLAVEFLLLKFEITVYSEKNIIIKRLVIPDF